MWEEKLKKIAREAKELQEAARRQFKIVSWTDLFPKKAPERPAGHINHMKPGSSAKMLYCLQRVPGRLVWPGTGRRGREVRFDGEDCC